MPVEHNYFTCQCGTPHHFLHVMRWVEEDHDDREVYFTVTDDGCGSLWNRIKSAFRHVFRGGELRINEVLLDPAMTSDLIVTLKVMLRHMKEGTKPKEGANPNE